MHPVNTELWLLIELVRLYCIILNETQYDTISSWSLTQINWGWNCADIFPSSYPPLLHPIAEWWPMYTWMRRPSPWPNSLNNVMSMPNYSVSLLIFHVLLGMFWASSPVFYCEMKFPRESSRKCLLLRDCAQQPVLIRSHTWLLLVPPCLLLFQKHHFL